MSAMPEEFRPEECGPDESGPERTSDGPARDDTALGSPVVVRRNAGLAALIGAAGSAIAIAYLWRASQTGAAVDWVLCVVMALIGAAYLVALVDSRTPLLVADDLGVRIRLGSQWRGLPWEALGQVVVRPRRGLLRDGRLLFAPRNPDRAMAGLDSRGRWHARLAVRAYGAPLAVPLGMTTRLSSRNAVRDDLAALAAGRVDVIEVPGDSAASTASAAPEAPTTDEPFARPTPDPEPATPRRTLFGTLGTIVSRGAKRPESAGSGDGAGVAPSAPVPPQSATPSAGPASPLRPTRPASRAEVTRDLPATFGNAALHLYPAQRDTDQQDSDRAATFERSSLHRPGSVDLVLEPPEPSTVRPIARAGEAVEPLVIDEFVVEPAYDPVVGPELAAARTRLGMTVDDLADRTRIRPHVLEAIEVDDFAPCGGDFYARGHLRTLARVLGQDPAPLLAAFEERYATAPLDARRVFEAELATGMTGSMRRTGGGPSWGLLVGVVLALVLVWGVVRLFGGTPQEQLVPVGPVQSAPAVHNNAYPQPPAGAAVPLRMTLVATRATGTVVVRDGHGRIVFSGSLSQGERKRLHATPPVRVRAADAGSVDVRLGGHDAGALGADGQPGRRTFRP